MKQGDRVPSLERTLDLPSLVAYAAATWDWFDVHYDQSAAVRAGLTAPLVDGQMLGALLAEHALDAFGGRGRITRMSFRFRSPVVAGETIRCEGTIEELGDGHAVLAQQVFVGDRVAVGPATTVVELEEEMA